MEYATYGKMQAKYIPCAFQVYIQSQLLESYIHNVYNDIQQTVCKMNDFLPTCITYETRFSNFLVISKPVTLL